MKKSFVIIIVSMSALAISSFGLKSLASRNDVDAREQFATSIVAALKESSTKKYVLLFPEVSDFKKIMNRHASIYGESLQEAQRDFEKDYQQKILPQVKAAFENVIAEGKKRGINWNSVSLIKTEAIENKSAEWSTAPLELTLQSGKVIFKIKIEKALQVEGEWRSSQYITLF